MKTEEVKVKTEELLDERNSTHGDFHQQFACAQEIKHLFSRYHYGKCTDVQTECLDQIAHKLSRILTGNSLFFDHWKDIAGYAILGERICHEPRVQMPPEAKTIGRGSTDPFRK